MFVVGLLVLLLREVAAGGGCAGRCGGEIHDPLVQIRELCEHGGNHRLLERNLADAVEAGEESHKRLWNVGCDPRPGRDAGRLALAPAEPVANTALVVSGLKGAIVVDAGHGVDITDRVGVFVVVVEHADPRASGDGFHV